MPASERNWCGISFHRIGAIELARDPDGAILEFQPHERYSKRDRARLNKHGAGPFCRIKVATGVRSSGVYVVVSDDAVRYVGICQYLAERWGPRGYGSIQPRNCYVGGQSTNCKVNNAILTEGLSGHRLALWFTESQNRAADERRLIAALGPPWNGRLAQGG